MDSDASVTSAILSAALRCNTIRLTLSISSSVPSNTCCLDKPPTLRPQPPQLCGKKDALTRHDRVCSLEGNMILMLM